MATPHRPLLRRLARWHRDKRGIAAVEFALILPILIAFFLGMSEVQPGISIKRKLSVVTRTLADLTTRGDNLTKTDLKNVFDASTAVMRPYDTPGTPQMVITSVIITKSGSAYNGTAEWSCGWNLASSPGRDDLTTRSGAYAVPDAFQTDAAKSFVMVETQYPYTPGIGYQITGTIRLNDSSPWPVRDADKVKAPTGSNPAGMSCKGA